LVSVALHQLGPLQSPQLLSLRSIAVAAGGRTTSVRVNLLAEGVKCDGYPTPTFVDELADLRALVDGNACSDYDSGSDDYTCVSRRLLALLNVPRIQARGNLSDVVEV
jgi:hypothetical protein